MRPIAKERQKVIMRSREAAAAAAWMLGALASASGLLTGSGARPFAAASQIAVTAAGSTVTLYTLPQGTIQATHPTSGKVLAVAALDERAAWLVEDGQRRELVVKMGKNSPSSYVLPLGAQGNRLAWIGGNVAVLGDQGGALWSSSASGWVPAERFMPPEAASLFSTSFVQASGNGMVSFIRPFRLMTVGTVRRTLSAAMTWIVVDGEWRRLGTVMTSAPRYQRITGAKYDPEGRFLQASFQMSATRVAADRYGLVALEDDGLLRAPFLQGAWTVERKPLSGPPAAWSEQIAAAGTSLYRLSGNRLVAQDLETGASSALFPWGFASPMTALHSDGESLWALTAGGPRLVSQDRSQNWGFLNAPLASSPLNDEQSRLLAALEPWMGAPYVLGGSTKAGVDCSGLVTQVFLGLGYSLPRTSGQIKTSPLGTVVKDELKVGDIIWTPGHVAIYVGNGETIEAVRGGVRRMTIWRFRDAVVKRFLRTTQPPVQP
jgi:cell wall-associated NlpC family hydrolase